MHQYDIVLLPCAVTHAGSTLHLVSQNVAGEKVWNDSVESGSSIIVSQKSVVVETQAKDVGQEEDDLGFISAVGLSDVDVGVAEFGILRAQRDGISYVLCSETWQEGLRTFPSYSTS